MIIFLSKNTLKLYEKYCKKYPNTKREHFDSLTGSEWYGLGLSDEEVAEVLLKCLNEDKIFQVWDLKYKDDPDNPPLDWWEGKLVFKKYKN